MSYRQPLCWCSVGVWMVVLVGNLPRWSECSMLTYCNFEGETNTCSIFLHNSVQIIVAQRILSFGYLTLFFQSPLSFRRIFRLSCTNMGVVSRYYRLQSLFSDGWIGTACHLGQTWKLFIQWPGSTSCMAKWAMQWMWAGSKRWAKGSLQSFQCLEVVVRRVRMCGEIRRPSHGRYGTWTV